MHLILTKRPSVIVLLTPLVVRIRHDLSPDEPSAVRRGYADLGSVDGGGLLLHQRYV